MFVVGLLAIVVLMVPRVKGAILIGIVVATVLAVVIEAIADIGPSFIAPGKVNPHGWGLNVPALPDTGRDTPDFGLLGDFSLLGLLGPGRLRRRRCCSSSRCCWPTSSTRWAR